MDNPNIMMQPEQEQQPQQPMYPPYMIQRDDKADLLDKIRPDDIVDKIYQKLLGKEYIDDKWVQVGPAILSPIGAQQIAALMLPVSSRNISLTKLNDEEIKRRLINIAKQAQYTMLTNWKAFGIKNEDTLGFVHEIVFSNTLASLKQSENALIISLLKGTTMEMRQTLTNEQPKTNWISNILKLKGR